MNIQEIKDTVDKFGTNSYKFNQVLKKQARDWFEREFVACASGAVDKTVSEDNCDHAETTLRMGIWQCATCGKPK